MPVSLAPTLLAPFTTLEDPRIERSKRYLLLDIIFIALCAVVSGANDCVAMEKFAKSKRAWLEKYLSLPDSNPCHDTFTRVFGTEGELRMTNPFHPADDDTFAIVHGDDVREHAAAPVGEHSFTPAIRHIHAVLRGRERPRHLAVDEAMGNARAIGALLTAAGRPPS